MTSSPPAALLGLRALVFDLMGTCTDWHTSLLPLLPGPDTSAGEYDRNAFLLEWRSAFFREIHARFEQNLAPEDIDLTHKRTLDGLISRLGVGIHDVDWTDELRSKLVNQWHVQTAWLDAVDGITRLKSKYFTVVLANGTTRLQLDISQSSQLPFHALLSSELLGLTKPDLAIYRRATELLQLKPEECAMVAAHAYDLRAAAKIGMRTIYIQRDTEDKEEQMDILRSEFDWFVDGTRKLAATGGLSIVADGLGA